MLIRKILGYFRLRRLLELRYQGYFRLTSARWPLLQIQDFERWRLSLPPYVTTALPVSFGFSLADACNSKITMPYSAISMQSFRYFRIAPYIVGPARRRWRNSFPDAAAEAG